MRKRLYILPFLFFQFMVGHAQNGQFSQFYSTSIFINPAFAGTDPTLSTQFNYKKSKLGSDGSIHELTQATVAYPVHETNNRSYQIGGAGLTFFKEDQGVNGAFSIQKLLLTGAYRLRLNSKATQNLVFGLQGGVVQNKISLDQLQWGSQYNPYIGFDSSLGAEDLGKSTFYYPVFNFGIIYAARTEKNSLAGDKSLVIGLSADNLNAPKSRFGGIYLSDHPIFLKLITTAKVALNLKTAIYPSIFSIYSSKSYQLNIGSHISHQLNATDADREMIIQFGSWYRVMNSLTVMGGLKINNLSVGLSYDMNANNYSPDDVFKQITPAVEVSIGYNVNIYGKAFNHNTPLF